MNKLEFEVRIMKILDNLFAIKLQSISIKNLDWDI